MGDSIPECAEILTGQTTMASRLAGNQPQRCKMPNPSNAAWVPMSPRGNCVQVVALSNHRGNKNGVDMDREHIKGAADKAKGAIKDTAGKMTGDKELQSEGKLDKAKGAAHEALGNVKDAARNLTK
jgi:uncharacterized protein YjbJ (UPF0337 family)